MYRMKPQIMFQGTVALVVLVCLAMIGMADPHEGRAGAQGLFTLTPSPTPAPGTILVYSANGHYYAMYSDQEYGMMQLYLSTNKNTPLTPRDGHATEPAWSPDGRRIAYTWRAPEGEASFIERIAPDGTARQRLTTGGREYVPDWSPDGTFLYFATKSDSGPQPNGTISRMNADGSAVHVLRQGLNVDSLDVSPDGTRLLLVSSHEGRPRLYVLEISSGDLQALLDPQLFPYDAVWSPDGIQIACAATDGIYLADAAGQEVRKLALKGVMMFALEDGFGAGDLAWSPDGRSLALVIASGRLAMAVSTPVPYDRIGAQLFLLDIASGELQMQTYGFYNADPDWEPLGRR